MTTASTRHVARRAAIVTVLAAGVLGLAGCVAPGSAAEVGAAAASVAPGSTTSPSPSSSTRQDGAPPSATPSTTPSPPASAPSPEESAAGAAGTALEALLALEVRDEASSDGYSREQFGDGWVDIDGNGCSTRDDMLAERLENAETSGSCTVRSGDLADPFTGEWIHFERGGASEVDIDHLVALSAAWTTGAQDLTYSERVSLANDPLNLEPVDAGENRAKGDDDAAEWLPPAAGFACEYVARQVAVKAKYDLWVTPVELGAMTEVLETCPSQPLPAPGDQLVISSGLGEAPTPAVAHEPEAVVEPERTSESYDVADLDPRYEYCNRLPAGLGPYVKGTDPEYEWYTDRDGDGVVCE